MNAYNNKQVILTFTMTETGPSLFLYVCFPDSLISLPGFGWGRWRRIWKAKSQCDPWRRGKWGGNPECYDFLHNTTAYDTESLIFLSCLLPWRFFEFKSWLSRLNMWTAYYYYQRLVHGIINSNLASSPILQSFYLNKKKLFFLLWTLKCFNVQIICFYIIHSCFFQQSPITN